MSSRTASRRLSAAMTAAVTVLVLAVMMFPLYWIERATSLKKEIEIFRVPPTLVPHELNTDSYFAQIQRGDFNMFRSFRNSIVISTCAMLISLVLAIPASYGVARFAFKGKRLFILGFLVTQMLPVSVLLTPMFITFRNLHILNTLLSAILADATIGIPFSVLILMSYFASIPGELSDAARRRVIIFGPSCPSFSPLPLPGLSCAWSFPFSTGGVTLRTG